MANEGKILVLSLLFVLFTLLLFSHQEKTTVTIDYPYTWSGVEIVHQGLQGNMIAVYDTYYTCPTKFGEKTVLLPQWGSPITIEKFYVYYSGVWIYFSNGSPKKTIASCKSPDMSMKFDNVLYFIMNGKTYVPISKDTNGTDFTIYISDTTTTTIILEGVTITSKTIRT